MALVAVMVATTIAPSKPIQTADQLRAIRAQLPLIEHPLKSVVPQPIHIPKAKRSRGTQEQQRETCHRPGGSPSASHRLLIGSTPCCLNIESATS